MSIARVAWMFSVGPMIVTAGVVSDQATSAGAAQAYPNKPIRIVTSSVGGGGDFTARQIAQGISGSLGQSVIVENRSTVAIAAEVVSKASPDGYTLVLSGSSVWILPLLQTTRYDLAKDFSPITTTDKSPNILAVHPSVLATSVQELIALAKARPGELTYGSSPVGTPTHLSVELFKSMTGVKIVHVPYKGSGPALTGVLSGEVQMGFLTPPSTMPHVKSGKLRALGVTSAEPSALVPGVATIAASLPGYEAVVLTAMFAPVKTPAVVINRLNQEVVRFLKTAEAKERFFNSGVETVGNSPQELAASMKSDMARWGKLIKDAGIRAE